MLRPKFVQRLAFQRSVAHDALCFRSIDNFPRLADPLVCWQIFPEEVRELTAAPNALHENGLEGEGTGAAGPRVHVIAAKGKGGRPLTIAGRYCRSLSASKSALSIFGGCAKKAGALCIRAAATFS